MLNRRRSRCGKQIISLIIVVSIFISCLLFINLGVFAVGINNTDIDIITNEKSKANKAEANGISSNLDTVVRIIANISTTVKLSNMENGKEYFAFVDEGKNAIFKELEYGTYEISCENVLNISFEGSEELTNNRFILSSTDKEHSITVKNNHITKGGFYSIDEKDNVFCIDVIPPEIILQGDETIILHAEDRYAEPGYVAIDNIEGDITNRVTVTNNVTKNIGTYEIIYQVADWYGNVTTITRTVKVLSQDFEYIGEYQTFVAPASGIYNIELWGASGSIRNDLEAPGKGGYVSRKYTSC